jgi:tetratricopeptide (TPR) repeat protein
MKEKKILAANFRALTRIKRRKMKKLKNTKFIVYFCLFASICSFIFFFSFDFKTPKVLAEDFQNEIEKAMFTRQEFFGVEAIVPLPTAEARENLIKLTENSPENDEILEKLAETNEKLTFYDEAEKNYVRLAEIHAVNLEKLAAFYERRGRFEKQGETLRKILFSTAAENRADAFARLIAAARKHDLQAYLQPEFYAEVARENPNLYPIFETLIDNLFEKKNHAEALKVVHQAKSAFPARQNVLLDKEIEILLANNQTREAEAVFQALFDPFWSDARAEKFYDFLDRQDRLRAYGAEIKTRFNRNPADFDAAVRLALYRNHDYEYGNDAITPIILRLEQAKKDWTTDEIVTATRLLIRANEPESASRFLYTLYARGDFKSNSALRAKILYQLFEMFSDAEKRKLPISKGDLRFYEDVARADASPGITTGILSLIFSDANPQARLIEQETRAMKYFNRAAAHRIFEEYKKENPNLPELAQMYLDLVRLYAATGETEIAEKTLNEFAVNYTNSNDFADAALKLADAFAALEKPEKMREVYQRALNYLGKNQKSKRKNLRNSIEFTIAGKENSIDEISAVDSPENRNRGINVPAKLEKTENNYYDEPKSNFNDYLDRKTVEITYEEVLDKLVSSLLNEKKMTEIFAVYSGEIEKYPGEEWLYERRAAWLEQTNLAEEQLKIYKEALERFPTTAWRDRLARFFVRQKRAEEFAEFSANLIEKLGDADARDYLSQFVDAKISAGDFDRNLYFKLYRSAHRRFPHNLDFVNGLLRFYQTTERQTEWRKLAAEYYFASPEVREPFLNHLSKTGALREYLAKAAGDTTIYELFRADASVRLSNYENAVAAYRRLNRLYPNTPEFSGRFISLTRSFGQKNPELLNEAANVAEASADFQISSTDLRTRSGEIFAELGNYEKARAEWKKLTATASGEREVYLDTATVYWDYFQYDDALRTIKILREKFADETLYAFETGAILEARHKKNEAIAEYVKALDTSEDNERQKEKAKKRLVFLTAKEESNTKIHENSRNETSIKIEKAFFNEKSRRGDAAFLSLGYAEFLTASKQTKKAEPILNQAIRNSSNLDFLEAAKGFYQTDQTKSGEQIALKRLSEVAPSARQKIQNALDLAESFEESGDPIKAKKVLDGLAGKFPTNYGVLIEASNFYKRLGYENESAQILRNALPRSRGEYRNRIAAKLAARLVNLDRVEEAELVLVALHGENPADETIFRELAKVCVRTKNADLMRKSFAETIAELKKSDAERREIDDRIADLRREMIDAFTRLGDYESAIEQHIEIINREPENEQLTETALQYARRYGGAKTLLDYYLNLSAEAFKNYRWNVVLARIYEAGGDRENAVANYETAIVNQPEMPELYAAIAEIETKRNNIDAALKNLDEVLILTNDAPEFVKKKIELLRRAGRIAEAEKEKAKLPIEPEKKIPLDDFAEARSLQNTEKEKAGEIYQQAFKKLIENPLADQLQTADLAAYIQFARENEPLDAVNEKLWNLREKLIAVAEKAESLQAKEARERLRTTNGAIVEAVGNIAGNLATDEELAALHADLQSRINEISFASDAHQTLATIQDLSRRARFGDLEETILRKRIDETAPGSERQIYVRNLVNFFAERGAYQETFDALERYGYDDLNLKAETARLIGNREKELEALRLIYWKPSDKIAVSPDGNVHRFLEILHVENSGELQSLTEKSSAYQLQLINFLLGKGEREPAHAAIENSNFSAAWKASRHAETSLALKEFGEKSECYFCAALQFASIGEMIRQTPDKKRFLINDDWFRLTREYGEWVFEKNETQPNADSHRVENADKYLTAMTENLPQSAAEQSKLGAFYLARNELKAAVEHFRLAAELDADNQTISSSLGAAYFKIGKTGEAEQSWTNAVKDKTIESGAVYFQTLHRYGLSEKGREKLPPFFVNFLETNDAENSAAFQNLIRAVAASFDNESEKAAYFMEILRKRPTDVSLAAMLITENLIGENERGVFYESLIERAADSGDYDYEFQEIARRVWTNADAESVYEQENGYETKKLENDKLEWQGKYLSFLLKQRENAKATRLIAALEKNFKGKSARPAWLRLAKIRTEIRAGIFDLNETENFVGIKVSDAATRIIAPSVERLNDVLGILREENRSAEAIILSENYFARSLAVGQFDASNFTGFARTFFQKGETEKAFQILHLMIKASDGNSLETAQAEIAALDMVKAKAADAAKTPPARNSLTNQSNTLAVVAEIVSEFGQMEKAIEFRRELSIAEPLNFDNKIKLAELLITANQKDEAAKILGQIIAERSATRGARWNARKILLDAGENVEFTNVKFDPFSQFYQGVEREKTNQTEAAEFFINALIADRDAEISARQKLVESYAATNKHFAAFRFAESIKSNKPDKLLKTLSETAEKIGDHEKALEFEKAKISTDSERIAFLQKLADEKNRRATEFSVDSENTRKL